MNTYKDIFTYSLLFLRREKEGCPHDSDKIHINNCYYQSMIDRFIDVRNTTKSIDVLRIELDFIMVKIISQNNLEADIIHGLVLLKGLLLAASSCDTEFFYQLGKYNLNSEDYDELRYEVCTIMKED